MDVLYFYRERARFIRIFYDTAGKPFQTTIAAIEAELPPFDSPPYSEDDEPAYLGEWIEANEALEVLGRTCLSMLSSSLHLYFRTWERELGVQCALGERKKVFNERGFVEGYFKCFEDVLGIARQDCPADLSLIEQIVLARNRDQHPQELTSLRVNHATADMKKHGHLFFMSEAERAMFSDSDMSENRFMDPAVHVSRDLLYLAIRQTDKFLEWLEGHMITGKWGR